MGRKLLFVINPNSGKGRIKNKLLEVVDIFIKDGWNVSVYITQRALDACKIVEESGEGFDRVVVSGGDGTLNEVIWGVMKIPEKKRPHIGYIPAGTVNDFASNMHISKNIIKAAQKAIGDEKFRCDVGNFGDKNFVYIAAFGAFTDVSYETPQQNKNILGQLAYFLEGIKKIHNLPFCKMRITCNGDVLEDEFILGMVSNSNRIAGFKTGKALKAELNDGLFEVVLIKRPKTLMELSDLGSRLLTQDLNCDMIKIFRTSSIRFEAEEEVRWTLDGEFGGSVLNTEISVNKEAVTLII